MGDPQKVFVGFDGFVDTLSYCVDERVGPQEYRRIMTMERFSERVRSASSRSANIECVVQNRTLGGNAPLLAQTLASLDTSLDLVACCGFPSVNPVFSSLEGPLVSLYSFGEPGRTDALEFVDGKLLLGKMEEVGSLTLENALSRLQENLLPALVNEASLIATVNWTMMPLVGEFWQWLLNEKELFRKTQRKKYLFTDLADPAKRPLEDLRRALSQLTQLNEFFKVVLGLNRAEYEQISRIIDVPFQEMTLQRTAEVLRERLSLSCVVLHTHKKVAACSFEGGKFVSEDVEVPFCHVLKRSTGAGDAFNGGFLYSILKGEELLQSLKVAIASSGIWVRSGMPATPSAIVQFIALWQQDQSQLDKAFS
jgi:hypothetical protein